MKKPWTYATLPKGEGHAEHEGDWYIDYQDAVMHLNGLYVYENDSPVNTGVLDGKGNLIWRFPEKVKMGFIK